VVEHTMDVSGRLRKQLEETSAELLRVMVKEMAEALMSADADAACGAGYGERSPERVNRRNGYRERGLPAAERSGAVRRVDTSKTSPAPISAGAWHAHWYTASLRVPARRRPAISPRGRGLRIEGFRNNGCIG
jgi:Transposase, Mutator family